MSSPGCEVWLLPSSLHGKTYKSCWFVCFCLAGKLQDRLKFPLFIQHMVTPTQRFRDQRTKFYLMWRAEAHLDSSNNWKLFVKNWMKKNVIVETHQNVSLIVAELQPDGSEVTSWAAVTCSVSKVTAEISGWTSKLSLLHSQCFCPCSSSAGTGTVFL